MKKSLVKTFLILLPAIFLALGCSVKSDLSGTTPSVALPKVNFLNSISSANEDSGTVTVTVTLENKTGLDVTVDYTINELSAEGDDYVLANGTLTFVYPSTSEDITITLNPDSVPEYEEALQIDLNVTSGNAVNGSQLSHTHTIINDDFTGNIWTGLGGDSLWSNDLNWEDGSKPTNLESAFFFPGLCAGANCDVSIDQNVDVKGLVMKAGYAGTITQQNTFTIDVGDQSWYLEDGVFLGGDSDITIVGEYVQLAGSFAATSSTTAFGGSLDVKAGATFSGGGLTSTITFIPLANATVTVADPININSLVIHTGGGRLNLTGTINIAGDLDITAPWIRALGGDSILNVSGDLTQHGFSSIYPSILIRIVGAGAQTIQANNAGDEYYTFFPSIEIASTSDVSLVGEISIIGDITHTSSNSVITAGSTVNFLGSYDVMVDAASMNFNDVVVGKGGGSLTFIGTQTVLGHFSTNCYNAPFADCGAVDFFDIFGDIMVELNVNLSSDGLFIRNPSESYLNITFNGAGNQSFNPQLFPGGNITLNKASGTVFQVTSDLDTGTGSGGAPGDFSLISGDYHMNFLNTNIAGNFSTAAGANLYKQCQPLTYSSYSPSDGTIVDGTSSPDISISDAVDVTPLTNHVEGDSGTQTFRFTVNLSSPDCVGGTDVNYATQDTTATAGSDYVATSGTLNFAAGEYIKTIDVLVNGDTDIEATEFFKMVLSAPSQGTIVDSEGDAFILDDD